MMLNSERFKFDALPFTYCVVRAIEERVVLVRYLGYMYKSVRNYCMQFESNSVKPHIKHRISLMAHVFIVLQLYVLKRSDARHLELKVLSNTLSLYVVGVCINEGSRAFEFWLLDMFAVEIVGQEKLNKVCLALL